MRTSSSRLLREQHAEAESSNETWWPILYRISTAPGPGAFFAKPEERTPEQRAVIAYSDALIDELRRADVLVLGLPMYNFGVPSQLKAWFDHIARAGETFKYTEKGPVGLLTGKKAYVFATRGGLYGDDHSQSEFVRQFLGFLGITDVEFVYAEGLAISPESRNNSLIAAQARSPAPRHTVADPACGVTKEKSQ